MTNWQNGGRKGCADDPDSARLDALLDELKYAEPPAPSIVREVMTTIRATSNSPK